MFACMLTAVSCSSPSDDMGGANDYGEGAVSLSVGVETGIEIVTKSSDQYQLASSLLPSTDEYTLRVTGEYTDRDGVDQVYACNFDSIDDYNSATIDEKGNACPPYLINGNYTATITDNRDGSVEGNNNAHFYGTLDFIVSSRTETTETVNLTMQNSAFRVVATDAFRSYFAGGAEIKIYTEKGSTITYSYDGTTDSTDEELIFVAAGTKLYIGGWAIKQNTTEESGSGTTVTFNDTTFGSATTAGTLKTVSIDAEGVGSATINITIDGEVKATYNSSVDLNPKN